MKLGKTLLVTATALLISSGVMAKGYGFNQSSNSAQLSASAEETLIFMREEEKVARDIYRVLSEQWGVRVFSNITQSEQKHMDAIGRKLSQYGIQDPITNDATGAFTNPELKQIYQDLQSRGSLSLQEALQVGAFIEEFDIRDLKQAINETSQADLIKVYENLLRGSRNHLRAFVGQIEGQGTAYTAQVLSAEEVDAIVSTSMERGGNKQGKGRGQGRGNGQGMGQGRSNW